MGFRKTLLKFMNLVYIAGAGVAIYGMCTKPIVSVDIGIELTSKQVGTYVAQAFGVANKTSKEYTVRLTYRAESESDKETFKDWLTEEKIANAFPKGLSIHKPIEVPLAKAFEFKNQNILKETVVENLDAFINEAVDKVAPGVHNLFKEAAEDKAKDVLHDEINQMITDFFGDDASQQVTEEEVQEIFDNIYALVEDNSASADQITGAILGQDENEAGLYKILAERAAQNDNKQIANVSEERFNDEKGNDPATLFVKEGDEFVPISGDYDPEATYYEEYNPDKVNAENISDAIIDSLEAFDGMVEHTGTYKLCDPQPTQSQVEADLLKAEADRKYFIKDGDNYVRPTEWNDSVEYYKEEVLINDVDTALAYLLDQILNGEKSDKVAHRVSRAEAEKSEADVRKVLNDYIRKFIPVSAIDGVSAKIGNKVAYILLGVVAFFILPWAWFGLLTLVRTLRRRKCWTRAWMVFVLAFPQLILGIILRYGTTGILSAVGNKVEILKTISQIVVPVIRFNCLWASFVYLAMIPFGLIYLVVASPFKHQWRFEKQLKIHDREKAQREARKRR